MKWQKSAAREHRENDKNQPQKWPKSATKGPSVLRDGRNQPRTGRQTHVHTGLFFYINRNKRQGTWSRVEDNSYSPTSSHNFFRCIWCFFVCMVLGNTTEDWCPCSNLGVTLGWVFSCTSIQHLVWRQEVRCFQHSFHLSRKRSLIFLFLFVRSSSGSNCSRSWLLQKRWPQRWPRSMPFHLLWFLPWTLHATWAAMHWA